MSLVPLLPCGTLSVLPETVRGIKVRCRSPLICVVRIFSIIGIGLLMMGTVPFLGVFLDQGSISLGYPFVYICFCSGEKQVCYGLMWIFKTRIYVCHHSLAFFNSILSGLLLSAIPGLCPLQVHFRVLVIFFFFFILFIQSVFLLCSLRSHI